VKMTESELTDRINEAAAAKARRPRESSQQTVDPPSPYTPKSQPMIAIAKDAPVFEHDCEQCTFLGRFQCHDLYFCRQGGNVSTVISRYGSAGPQYASGLEIGRKSLDPELAEAYRRAVERGLIPEPTSP